MSSLRSLAKAGVGFLDRMAAPLAGPPPSPSKALPCVFLIGGPRSGSTLVCQSMIVCRRFAYMNNLVSRFPQSGAAIAAFTMVGRWPRPQVFKSDYGDTDGLAGPSEGGDFWDRIFPWESHHSVDPEDFPDDLAEELRRMVHRLSTEYGAPFLAKNLWNSIRLNAINKALPNSIFVVLKRNPVLMAQSLLEGRRKKIGDSRELWSIRPRQMLNHLGESPIRQTAYQLAYTYQAIERAREELGSHRFFGLPYDGFCADPQSWLERIDEFLGANGVSVNKLNKIEEPFSATTTLRLSPNDIEELETVFKEAWPGGYSPIENDR